MKTTQPTSEAKAIARTIYNYWMSKVDAYPTLGSIFEAAAKSDARATERIDEIQGMKIFSCDDIDYIRRAEYLFSLMFIHRSKQVSREAIANNFRI